MAEIRVPALGESVTEATIGKWFKKAGDVVAVDEPVVELETDKVTIEVPSPAAGVLTDVAAKDGETVAVGALLGAIKEGAGAVPAGRPDQKTERAKAVDAGPEQPQETRLLRQDGTYVRAYGASTSKLNRNGTRFGAQNFFVDLAQGRGEAKPDTEVPTDLDAA